MNLRHHLFFDGAVMAQTLCAAINRCLGKSDGAKSAPSHFFQWRTDGAIAQNRRGHAMSRRDPEPRPIFVLRIEGKPGRAIRDLRHLLKRLLRQHHFRALEVREDRDIAPDNWASR
jgi:hypothetical protein